MTSGVDDVPTPGDLFLDEELPECERVTLVRNGWRAAATHVWVGAGWARLVPGPVALVPARAPRRSRRPGLAAAGPVLAPRGRTAPDGGDGPRPPRREAAAPGPLPGPAPRSAEDLEHSHAEPRLLVRSARRA